MASPVSGLNEAQVEESRKRHGPNIMPSGERRWLKVLRDTLSEPMMALLTIACAIYFITGAAREGIMMAVALVFVSGISIYQQIRSAKAVSALQKLTSVNCRVIRNGKEITLPSEELVKDDIVWISEGERIAADGQIIQCNDLSTDESLLTGEAFPVSKDQNDLYVYSGTTVSSGSGFIRVTDVGAATRIGKLGLEMKQIKTSETPLQIQVRTFVRQMAFFGLTAFAAVWFFNYAATGDVLLGLMRGLTLAMSALPEEIPVALSTFMALGAYHLIRNNVLARHPQTVEALGAATVICVDKTGTITENRMTVDRIYVEATGQLYDASVCDQATHELLFYAVVASEEDPFDPMEKAIIASASEAGITLQGYTKTGEYPLSGSHPMMTHIYTSGNGQRIIGTKGAPEGIMECSGVTGEKRKAVEDKLKELASQGHRVLGVARSVFEGTLPEKQQDIPFEFLGLIALNDPPKRNIKEVIRSFKDAGIAVKLVTGDYSETAVAIAKATGISETGEILTGKQMKTMSDAELSSALARIFVFARVLPEDKLRIVRLLKSDGEVVAMTGDGVNDGPALKAAHIGIAMGKKGSEVAKQAASLILVNDDLGNMVTAVALGRKIYFNLKKAIRYIISIHIPLISIVALPLLLGWKFPNLFSPVHIIFMELIMGPTCSIVYENEPMEKGMMSQPPRKLTSTFFTWSELYTSILQGLVITVAMLSLLYYCIQSGYAETETRTVIFTTLILANILLTLTGRSENYSLFTTIRYKNKLVPVIILLTLSILAVLLWFEPASALFGMQSPGIQHLLMAIGVAVFSVAWIEIYKKLVRNR